MMLSIFPDSRRLYRSQFWEGKQNPRVFCSGIGIANFVVVPGPQHIGRAIHLNGLRRLRLIAPTKVATLGAQFRISCACSNERARACRDESIEDPTKRRKANARRLRQWLNWPVARTIPT